jgi:hypothetical protein
MEDTMTHLTEDQKHVLEELQRRPSGSYFREAVEKKAILELCAEAMVCDPHEGEKAMFTRITDKGLAALAAQEPDGSTTEIDTLRRNPS